MWSHHTPLWYVAPGWVRRISLAVLGEGQAGPGLPALGWVLPPEPFVCTSPG